MGVDEGGLQAGDQVVDDVRLGQDPVATGLDGLVDLVAAREIDERDDAGRPCLGGERAELREALSSVAVGVVQDQVGIPSVEGAVGSQANGPQSEGVAEVGQRAGGFGGFGRQTRTRPDSWGSGCSVRRSQSSSGAMVGSRDHAARGASPAAGQSSASARAASWWQ